MWILCKIFGFVRLHLHRYRSLLTPSHLICLYVHRTLNRIDTHKLCLRLYRRRRRRRQRRTSTSQMMIPAKQWATSAEVHIVIVIQSSSSVNCMPIGNRPMHIMYKYNDTSHPININIIIFRNARSKSHWQRNKTTRLYSYIFGSEMYVPIVMQTLPNNTLFNFLIIFSGSIYIGYNLLVFIARTIGTCRECVCVCIGTSHKLNGYNLTMWRLFISRLMDDVFIIIIKC